MPPNPRRATSPSPVGVRPNTVNLRSWALFDLLDKLDVPESKQKGPGRRTYVRWPFRRESIEVHVVHPGGNVVAIRVACRNISCTGTSVLHNSYFHPGSECRTLLPHPTRGIVEVPGTISRCLHRGGVIHELGISFASPINVREFLRTDPFSNQFSLEKVQPQDLAGRILLVQHSATDRSILKHFLRDSRLVFIEVSTLAEAVLACENLDAIVISTDLPESDPATVVGTIRKCNYAGPILMLAPDASPETRARLAGLPYEAILVGQLTEDLLFRAMGEVLLIDHAPMSNAPTPHTRSTPVPDQLPLIGKSLARASSSRDAATIAATCQRLQELSETMGWAALTKLAGEVLAILGRGMPFDTIKPTLNKIMAACEPDSPKPAAK